MGVTRFKHYTLFDNEVQVVYRNDGKTVMVKIYYIHDTNILVEDRDYYHFYISDRHPITKETSKGLVEWLKDQSNTLESDNTISPIVANILADGNSILLKIKGQAY